MLTRDILELAARQHGVLTVDQLRDRWAISRATSARARRNGLLVEMAPGVVRVASSPESFESRCVAACLRSRGVGFVSGWTAGRIHGLRNMPTSPIHLTVPASSRRDYPPWCEVHRSTWYDDDQAFACNDGIRVATPLRMLFGLAAAFNQHRFERAAEDAWHLRLITPADAAAYLDEHRCRGKDGVARMEAWLERALARTRPSQSDLERRLAEAVVAAGLPDPQRQHPLVLRSGETIHLDLAWPPVKLAVEPGATWWHGGDLVARRDQMRDRACAELGWLVLRFDESMREDLTGAARQIARVYHHRRAELPDTG